jgi:hypothetical protein
MGMISFSYALSQRTVLSLFVPAFFLIGHEGYICNAFPATDWMFLFGQELHARSLAISICLLGVGLYFLQKRFLAWLTISVAIAIHIVSAFPIAFFMGVHTLWSVFFQKKHFFRLLYFILPITSVLLLFLAIPDGGSGGMDFFRVYDPQWIEFANRRSWWIFSWEHFSSISILLTIYLPLFLFYSLAVKSGLVHKAIAQKFHIFVASMVFLIGMGMIGFDLFHISIFGQFQFHRSSIWLRILLIIAAILILLWAIGQKKSSSFEKMVFLLALVALPFGGEHFFLPFTILCFFGSLFLLWKAQKKTFPKGFPFLFWGMSGLFISGSLIFSAETSSQIQNMTSAFGSLTSDPEIALGYVLLWIAKIFPAIFLAIGIVLISQRLPEHLFHKGVLLIPLVAFPAFFLFFSASYSSFVASPLASLSPLQTWITNNTTSDDLFLGTISAERETKKIRNHLGRNVMITYAEGGQGAFSRNYAMEWLHRREIQSDPKKYWDEITQKYKVDYLISGADEEFLNAEIVYSDDEYKIYSLQEEK